jgi:hypothetical protein
MLSGPSCEVKRSQAHWRCHPRTLPKGCWVSHCWLPMAPLAPTRYSGTPSPSTGHNRGITISMKACPLSRFRPYLRSISEAAPHTGVPSGARWARWAPQNLGASRTGSQYGPSTCFRASRRPHSTSACHWPGLSSKSCRRFVRTRAFRERISPFRTGHSVLYCLKP